MMQETSQQDSWQQAMASGMGPVPTQEPLASIDERGQVWPYETGTELDPTRAYVYSQEELQKAVDRMNSGPVVAVDALPNLHQGQQPQVQLNPHEMGQQNLAARRAATAMTMQIRDPAGIKIPGA